MTRRSPAMEALNALIGAMNAVDDDDEWMLPVFEEARKLFPPAPKG